MKNIAKKVEELTAFYKTRSPFEICEKLNIHIIFADLPKSVDGLFVKTKYNEEMILINNNIKTAKIKRTCAHELGHAILHKNVNILQLGENSELTKTLDSEAEYFSTLLLN